MTREGRHALAHAELELADECLAAARHDLSGRFIRRAVSSAYFAIFHAARAALAIVGYEPQSYTGLRQLFSLHLIRTGAFPPEDGRLMRHTQKDREEADYAHQSVFTEEDARLAIEGADDFVRRARAFAERAEQDPG